MQAFESSSTLLRWLKENPEHPVDLLVSDVVMPELSGPELWEVARRIRPGLEAIFVTGYAGDALQRYGISERRCLLKPISSDVLYHRLLKFIGNSAKESQ